MIRKLYFILPLTFLVISCSKDENLEGRWSLSAESIIKTVIDETEIDPTFKPELDKKLIDKIKNNIIYTFSTNGDFKLELISDADSINHFQKGVWSSSEDLLEINLSHNIYKYHFEINGKNLNLLNPEDSSDTFILNKISD